MSADPGLLGLKIIDERPVLSVLSSTVGSPVGVAVEVDLVEVVEATALVVEMVEEFVSGGVATMRPPLDTFQWTGVPLRGAPSSIVLTDIMAVWFMKIFGGPPLIVMTRGYGRKVIDIEATERPGVEIVRIVVPGTTGVMLSCA
jgi:hypothetical protein